MREPNLDRFNDEAFRRTSRRDHSRDREDVEYERRRDQELEEESEEDE